MQFRAVQRPVLYSLICCLFVADTTGQSLPKPGALRWVRVDTSASNDADGNQYFVDLSHLRYTEEGIRVDVLVQLRDPQT